MALAIFRKASSAVGDAFFGMIRVGRAVLFSISIIFVKCRMRFGKG